MFLMSCPDYILYNHFQYKQPLEIFYLIQKNELKTASNIVYIIMAALFYEVS